MRWLTLLLWAAPAGAHPFDDAWLTGLMQTEPASFAVALDPAQAAEHRLQVLVSLVQIEDGKPLLQRHGFRVDAEYYYPASALKTCAAVASLQRLAELKGVGLHTPLAFHPLFGAGPVATEDQANLRGGRITLGHLIRQMSLVSSNEAFNRLYEFAGHEALNRRMAAAGLKDTAFIHRLSRIMSPEANRKTPRIDIGRITLPATTSPLDLKNVGIPGLDVGEAHLEPGTGRHIDAPFSFTRKNRMSLVDLQHMLVMIVRPDIELGLAGLTLKPAHRRFLKRAMLQWPQDSKNPIYPARKYNPHRFKPVLPGLLRLGKRSRWQVYNKAGKAYGFRVENAYIVDKKKKRAFFFTATVYANPNRVVNDGKYAYDRVADPFIHALVRAVARAEWPGD